MKFLISFVISVFVTVIIYLIKAVSITDSKRIKLLKKAMTKNTEKTQCRFTKMHWMKTM